MLHFVCLYHLVQCKVIVVNREMLTMAEVYRDRHRHCHLIVRTNVIDSNRKLRDILMHRNFSFVVDKCFRQILIEQHRNKIVNIDFDLIPKNICRESLVQIEIFLRERGQFLYHVFHAMPMFR